MEQGEVDRLEVPLKTKDIWSIRTKLQVENRTRDLAKFNLAIDSKLRTLGHESIESTQIYLDADLELRQRILDTVTPPNGKPGRYRPDDKLLAFLKGL